MAYQGIYICEKKYCPRRALCMEEERDVSKFWNNGQIRLRLIGLENQMKTDKYMSLRVIGYDGAAYRARFLKKPKKPCYPIITLVLY